MDNYASIAEGTPPPSRRQRLIDKAFDMHAYYAARRRELLMSLDDEEWLSGKWSEASKAKYQSLRAESRPVEEALPRLINKSKSQFKPQQP